jgi:pimeloyl-ACP methyl ester carboxylesterase
VSKVLFLHCGPGLSAELERRRFGSTLPVHWWDQPRVAADSPEPYEKLLVAAQSELDRMYRHHGAPIPILASSFGARLAFSLMERVPHQIGAVSFQGGTLDLGRAFVRLGHCVAKRNGDNALQAITDSTEREPDGVWDLIGALFAVPNLLEFYWSPAAQSQYAAMSALAGEGRLMDATTFQVVAREVLVRRAPVGLKGWHSPVQVWIGKHDPFMRSSDVKEWQTVLPGAEARIVDAGHFPYMEMEAESWLPPLLRQSST